MRRQVLTVENEPDIRRIVIYPDRGKPIDMTYSALEMMLESMDDNIPILMRETPNAHTD